MRGTLRWARADLRAHRGQSLVTVAVVGGVVAALVLATMLLQGALNPWQQLFARTNGADTLVYLSAGTPPGRLATLPGVRAAAPAYDAAPATLVQGAERSPVEVRGMPFGRPALSAPLLVAGGWLRAGQPDEVVVEASFAAAAGVGVGSRLLVDGVDGTSVGMRVTGIADTADQGFYPRWTPGLIWAPRALLARVEPAASETSEVVGLRLADPSAAGASQVSQEVFDSYNGAGEGSPVERIVTSQQVRDSMASYDRLLGLLLALFGVIALVAAPCAIANVVTGRILMGRHDIAMLKAIGFTPGQVVRMLLAEQTLLGMAGTGLGLAAALIAASPEVVRPPDGIAVTFAPLPGTWTALIAAGTVIFVAAATAIPAWRARLVSPVAAVQPSPPRGHLSRIARLSLMVRLPAALVLGARDALTRRLPAAMTVVGVAIPMAMITIALVCWCTIGAFTSGPGRIGLASGLSVYPGGLTDAQTTALIATDPQVKGCYPGSEFDTLLPGDNGTFVARALGDSAQPYPFEPVAGRMFRSPYEAVAGQGFLDLMHVKVGSWIDPTVDGVPVILHIVGRTLEPDDNGDVLDFGLDALAAAGASSSPMFYRVVLRPGVPPAAARSRLLALSGRRLDVRAVADPAARLGVMRLVIGVAVVILALIALANLLTATDIGLKDHVHEAGILKAMGLTPRQVMATLVVAVTIVTAAGVVVGVAAGLAIAPRLINAQGQASGIGWGIAAGLSPAGVAALLAAALAVAVAAAAFLARRATTARDPLATSPSPATTLTPT
ncbi:MAG TPA: FtsX-like permease family protein [Trebonia sp.]|jgi:putative ABC transport system permease protein|nr:FtsX-like permease family protein [Trebonia sp.]